MSSQFLIRVRGESDGIVDLSNNNTITNHGVTIVEDNDFANGYAMYFSNNYFDILMPQDLTFSTDDDFTIAFFYKYPTSFPRYMGGFGNYNGGTPTLVISQEADESKPYIWVNGSLQVWPSTNISLGVVHHFAWVKSGANHTFYIDGITVGNVTYSSSLTFPRSRVFGAGAPNALSGYANDFCFVNEALWTSDFTPPTSYLSLNGVIYLSGQEVWGINGSGNFAKLNNNYSAMTDAEKIAIFDATNGDTPTISQLKTLTMPIKAVSYNADNAQPTCTVTAIPTPQTITPKGRISLNNYAKLKGVSITGGTTGDGVVKIAMTKDNSTYQVYDSTNLAWVDINISDIGTDGMSISDVAALTTAEWAAYDCMSSGIGFAYYLEMASTSDTAYTDELTLNVELLGELKSLVKGTDYDYSYVSNDVLQVKLYKNGDFRINYNPGES